MSIEQLSDDDAYARDGIEDLLQSAGLSVMSFGSVQEFLKSPRPDAPGCIVLDVRLPGTSGLEFQKVLIEAGVLLPVIFIGGRGNIPTRILRPSVAPLSRANLTSLSCICLTTSGPTATFCAGK